MKKPLTNMRVLLLAALAATVFGDGHTFTCANDCIAAVWTAVDAVPANLGYVDGDMAVYAYLLYRGYTAAGDAGLGWVAGVTTALAGEDLCNNDGSRAKITECFNAATADEVQGVQDWVDTLDADTKAGTEVVLGALANQLAAGSEPAKKWGGLSAETFGAALKVYYIVGAFAEVLNPIIAHTMGGAESAEAVACYNQLYTAIDYAAGTAEKQDLAYAIAMKGEELFGATGLGHALCFGEGSPASVFSEVTLGDGTKFTPTDAASILTELDSAKTTADTAVAAALEAASPSATDPSDASPAAALSALVAAVALML